jgi:hypothetical protein
MTVVNLRLYCRENKIKLASNAKKDDILRAIQRFTELGGLDPDHARLACESPRRAHKGRRNPITPSSKLKLSERRTQALKLARVRLQATPNTETSPSSGSATVANLYNWVFFILFY